MFLTCRLGREGLIKLPMMRGRCHSEEEVTAAESPPTYWRATDEESRSAHFDRITTFFLNRTVTMPPDCCRAPGGNPSLHSNANARSALYHQTNAS
jgi:hypothetical protein